jgi:hypothetical protein
MLLDKKKNLNNKDLKEEYVKIYLEYYTRKILNYYYYYYYFGTIMHLIFNTCNNLSIAKIK